MPAVKDDAFLNYLRSLDLTRKIQPETIVATAELLSTYLQRLTEELGPLSQSRYPIERDGKNGEWITKSIVQLQRDNGHALKDAQQLFRGTGPADDVKLADNILRHAVDVSIALGAAQEDHPNNKMLKHTEEIAGELVNDMRSLDDLRHAFTAGRAIGPKEGHTASITSRRSSGKHERD